MISSTPGDQQNNLNINDNNALTQNLLKEDKFFEKKSLGSSISSFLKRERIGIVIAVFSQFLWALNVITVKIGSKCDTFNSNNYSMWRSLGQVLITYYQCKRNGTYIPSYSEMKHKFWFLVRTFGNYFCYNSLILAIVYLRAATASCLAGANPFVIIVLSVWILHEKFYIRYIIGIIVCFIGSAMILLNEKHGGSQSVGEDANIPLGVFFGIIHVLFVGGCIFGQKIIVNDGVVTDVWVFYTGLYNFLTGFVVCFYNMNFGLNLKLIIVTMVNAVVFYYGQVFTDLALQRMDVSKYAPSSYIQTLFVFFLSLALFGETFYFTDVIGSFFIVAFHVYNAYDPIKPEKRVTTPQS